MLLAFMRLRDIETRQRTHSPFDQDLTDIAYVPKMYSISADIVVVHLANSSIIVDLHKNVSYRHFLVYEHIYLYFREMAEIVFVENSKNSKYTTSDKNMLLKIIKESDGGAHKKVIYDEIAATNSVKHRS